LPAAATGYPIGAHVEVASFDASNEFISIAEAGLSNIKNRRSSSSSTHFAHSTRMRISNAGKRKHAAAIALS
jgi:hypothetical protein